MGSYAQLAQQTEVDREAVLRMSLNPRRCAFLCGLPRTRVDFRKALIVGEYCRSISGGWGDYERWVVHGIEKLASLEETYGLIVIPYISADRFAGFLDGGLDLVVLFTHSRPDGFLEFSEGMVHRDRLIKALPRESTFIWDLLACRNDGFSEAVHERAPNMVVVSADRTLTPNSWLEYYAVMFAMIARFAASYSQAKLAADNYAHRMAHDR